VSRHRSSDRGAAAVEMAFVTMFLLILLLGIVDVGRAIVANISVRDAVQDGASYFAYTRDATAADVEARVRAAVSSPDLSTAATTVAVYCGSDPRDLLDGSRIRIDLTHDVDMITPLVGPALGGVITLSPSAEADRFFDTCPADAMPLPAP
jgi:Flp pilus assembly protein TadG